MWTSLTAYGVVIVCEVSGEVTQQKTRELISFEYTGMCCRSMPLCKLDYLFGFCPVGNLLFGLALVLQLTYSVRDDMQLPW